MDLFKKLENCQKIEFKSKENKNKSLLQRINSSSKGRVIQLDRQNNKIRNKNIKKRKNLKPNQKINFANNPANNKNKINKSRFNKKLTANKIQKGKTSSLNTKNICNNKNKTIERILFTDSEMNSFTYNEALQKDKRTFFQYYISLLKTNHPIIFTFHCSLDYNSIFMKIDLLLFTISLDYSINSLFYNDSTIHTIYENQGLFSFIYRIPQIIYSTLISSVITLVIRSLSLFENNVIEIKEMKKIVNMKETRFKLINCLICKFIFFLFFWNDVSFCVLGLFSDFLLCV